MHSVIAYDSKTIEKKQTCEMSTGQHVLKIIGKTKISNRTRVDHYFFYFGLTAVLMANSGFSCLQPPGSNLMYLIRYRTLTRFVGDMRIMDTVSAKYPLDTDEEIEHCRTRTKYQNEICATKQSSNPFFDYSTLVFSFSILFLGIFFFLLFFKL